MTTGNEEYARLLKLAEDGDVSVAELLLEAAERHDDDEGRRLAYLLFLQTSPSLDALVETLNRAAPVLGHEVPALRAFAEPVDRLPFRVGSILSWDADRVLVRTESGFAAMAHIDWYAHNVNQASDLDALAATLGHVWRSFDRWLDTHPEVDAFAEDGELSKALFVLMEQLPSFGGGRPTAMDTQQWVLSWDWSRVLVSPSWDVWHDRELVPRLYDDGYE